MKKLKSFCTSQANNYFLMRSFSLQRCLGGVFSFCFVFVSICLMLTRKRKFEAPQTEVVFDATSAEQWKALLGIWNLSGCHLHRKQLAIGVQATEKGGGWKRRCGHWRTPQFKQHKTLVKRRKMTDDEIFEEKFEDLEMTCVLTCAKCMEKEWPKKIITGDQSKGEQ